MEDAAPVAPLGSGHPIPLVEKPIFFLTALVLGIGSICELSTPHIEQVASNEVVVWVSEAALDADYQANYQAPAKATPNQPVLKIPDNFDPDRT